MSRIASENAEKNSVAEYLFTNTNPSSIPDIMSAIAPTPFPLIIEENNTISITNNNILPFFCEIFGLLTTSSTSGKSIRNIFRIVVNIAIPLVPNQNES